MLTARTPSDQTTALAIDGSPPGTFRIRCRAASTTEVKGLWLEKACSQPGMVLTGTKVELAKVRGNITRKPKAWTVVGFLSRTPSSVPKQEMAKPQSSTRDMAPTVCAG